MTKKYRAVIFDLDGTLLNTLDDLADSVNYALEQEKFPPRTTEEIRSFVGNGIRRLIELSTPRNATPQEVERVFEFFRNHYTENCCVKTKPYAGIPEILRFLREKQMKIAVVSNKNDAAAKRLISHFFDGLVDFTTGHREGGNRKPSPDGVNEALRFLGVPREEAVCIGDSEIDSQTAKNAGTDCILVDWGFRSHDSLIALNAEAVISAPTELEGLLYP